MIWKKYIVVLILWYCGVCVADSPWHSPNCEGNRRAIVHLFEWKWTDIAAECERFLGPRGFCGVQLSPANEHAMIGVDSDGQPDGSDYPRPWWERYQPVSYNMTSRSGTDGQFVDMVERCNNAGVRIYVDAVLNHMTGMGRRGVGSAGSEFDADLGEFPGVPYTMDNFNDCSKCDECCCINDWVSTDEVRNCRLVGLIDLDQSLPDTKDKTVAFLNNLIDIGVAGFRIDAAKHMWPSDLEVIQNELNDLNEDWFPTGSKPFVYLEVIDQNNPDEVRLDEYTHLGRVTEFRYCTKISETVWALWAIPGLYQPSWNMADPEDAFVFVDNHDNQRGHGGAGNVVTYKKEYDYKMAQAITLGWEYGYQRVMSSYDYGDDTDVGPPADDDFVTKDVPILENGLCGDGWVCEHRWPVVAGMAGWAKATNGIDQASDFWSEGNNAAWRKGDRGFVAMTNEGGLSRSFNTGLPAGQYCNVVQGCATADGCEGDTVTVGGDGMADISITDADNPIVAIHVECMSGSNQCVDDGGLLPTDPPTLEPTSPTTDNSTAGTTEPVTLTTPDGTTTTEPVTLSTPDGNVTTTITGTSPPSNTTTTAPGDGDWQTTVIYMHILTQMGQDGFLRGGVNQDMDGALDCVENDAGSDPCAVPVQLTSLGDDPHYDKYTAWADGDTRLDWYGAETEQGSYEGQPAHGTPMAWTTNDPTNPGYQPDNSFGENFWKVEMLMDCSKTYNAEEGLGWFELKTYVSNGGWEGEIIQDTDCSGTAGGEKPYDSWNHFGRCGHFNVFSFNSGACVIDDIL